MAASLLTAFLLAVPGVHSNPVPVSLDIEAQRWVDDTLKRMARDEKIWQLIVPSFFSEYTSSDSETYDRLVTLIHEYHVGAACSSSARASHDQTCYSIGRTPVTPVVNRSTPHP